MFVLILSLKKAQKGFREGKGFKAFGVLKFNIQV